MTAPYERQSPAGRPGKVRNTESVWENSTTTAMPFQVCLCADCAYFKLVRLPSGGIRHLCTFFGDRLPKAGRSLCTFRQGGDV